MNSEELLIEVKTLEKFTDDLRMELMNFAGMVGEFCGFLRTLKAMSASNASSNDYRRTIRKFSAEIEPKISNLLWKNARRKTNEI